MRGSWDLEVERDPKEKLQQGCCGGRIRTQVHSQFRDEEKLGPRKLQADASKSFQCTHTQMQHYAGMAV